MQPAIFDHLIAVFIIAVTPVLAVTGYRRFVARIRSGVPGVRLRTYRKTIASQWALAAAVLLAWRFAGRPAASLGLGIEPGIGFWVGAGLTGVACGLLVLQVVVLVRNPRRLRDVQPKFESVRELLPSCDREWRTWVVLSVTAGICEELAYRGFLIAYAAAYLGTGGGVVVSSLAFSVAHSYQGIRGAARSGAVGLMVAGLYLLTGSLWAPILLHIVIDVTSGQIARHVLRLPAGPGGTDSDVPPST